MVAEFFNCSKDDAGRSRFSLEEVEIRSNLGSNSVPIQVRFASEDVDWINSGSYHVSERGRFAPEEVENSGSNSVPAQGRFATEKVEISGSNSVPAQGHFATEKVENSGSNYVPAQGRFATEKVENSGSNYVPDVPAQGRFATEKVENSGSNYVPAQGRFATEKVEMSNLGWTSYPLQAKERNKEMVDSYHDRKLQLGLPSSDIDLDLRLGQPGRGQAGYDMDLNFCLTLSDQVQAGGSDPDPESLLGQSVQGQTGCDIDLNLCFYPFDHDQAGRSHSDPESPLVQFVQGQASGITENEAMSSFRFQSQKTSAPSLLPFWGKRKRRTAGRDPNHQQEP
ncbi:hypothetical protein NE237_033192 [Protea cynaroides]|uniref:Uncharacterized protein n=1 Tax=Protea cynaroides TaxID=273540 RepID=A0A9Q0L546_9MAGN|nr:hypothetical protein NE237_033192 [Protea cynaroides]